MKQASLTKKILSLMLLLILVSSGLALFAIVNLSYSLGDARTINASGSLRMQSYRLLQSADENEALLQNNIVQFEQTLYSEALKPHFAWMDPSNIADQYFLVIEKWKQMKVFLLNKQRDEYAAALTDFADTIDTLVSMMEHQAAFKLRLLAISQVIGLGLMLFIAFLAVRYTKRKLVSPLQQLMQSAASISKGNFEVDIPATEFIELTSLSDALQTTARELSTLYRDLAGQVAGKTLALTKANKELSFLYDNLLRLDADKLDDTSLKSALDQLKSHESLAYLRLVIAQGDDMPQTITASGGWPTDGVEPVAFALHFEQTHLGFLEVISDTKPSTPLFENFAIMLARAIMLHQASEQRQQLALMEERGVIARELHDSLGQVLSFLKIQLNLLHKRLGKTCLTQEVEAQMNEINQGVNAAYVQLRELLSTFRLTIKEPNLRCTLESVLEQLRQQTEANLSLDYRLAPGLLNPNQHIHVLQLMREATLNAIKHASADNIDLCCSQNVDGLIECRIDDDGIGVAHLQTRDHHFGIGIMQERAAKLGGRVEFSANQRGGSSVTLRFPPQQEPSHG